MQIKDLPSSNTLSRTDVLAKDTSGGITQKITGAALAEQLKGIGNYLDSTSITVSGTSLVVSTT